jgi:hypothetical protein
MSNEENKTNGRPEADAGWIEYSFDIEEVHPYAVCSWLTVCAWHGWIPAMDVGPSTLGDGKESAEFRHLRLSTILPPRKQDHALPELHLVIRIEESIAALAGAYIRLAQKKGWKPSTGPNELLSYLETHGLAVNSLGDLLVEHLRRVTPRSAYKETALGGMTPWATLSQATSHNYSLSEIYGSVGNTLANHWNIVSQIVNAIPRKMTPEKYWKIVQPIYNRRLLNVLKL